MPTHVHPRIEYMRYQYRNDPSAEWAVQPGRTYISNDTVYTGGPVPNWRKRIRMGLQATTPMEVTGSRVISKNDGYAKSHYRHPLGFISYQEIKGQIIWLDYASLDPSAFVIQSVKNQVRMDIVAKIRKAQTQMKSLVSLGELGETVRMVNSAGQALNRGMWSYLDEVSKRARRGQITPAALMRWVGSRWLEYVFGWKPLIADIDDGITAFAKLYVGRPPMMFVKAQSESSEKIPMTPFVTNNFASGTFTRTPMHSLSYGYRIYGAVSISNQGVGAMRHAYGIKLDEFIPTIYDLIPLSFLADYFVNLGAVIDALSFNSSVIRWLNHGELRQSEFTIAHSYVKTPPAAPWIEVDHQVDLGTPFKVTRYYKYRNGLPDYSALVPSLQFQIPSSSTRWVNMAALGAQMSSTSRQIRNLRV